MCFQCQPESAFSVYLSDRQCECHLGLFCAPNAPITEHSIMCPPSEHFGIMRPPFSLPPFLSFFFAPLSSFLSDVFAHQPMCFVGVRPQDHHQQHRLELYFRTVVLKGSTNIKGDSYYRLDKDIILGGIKLPSKPGILNNILDEPEVLNNIRPTTSNSQVYIPLYCCLVTRV